MRMLQPGVFSLAASGPRLKHGQYKPTDIWPLDFYVIYSLETPLLGVEAGEEEVGSPVQGCWAAPEVGKLR